jgi:aldose 1-epimerase
MIAGDYITPTFSDLIPTGAIERVENTIYDFTVLRPIGAVQPMLRRVSYDINYVLRQDGDDLAHAATLRSVKNGLSMELWTSEPGLQFYDGHLLNVPVPGLDGVHYGPHRGLCLEPQRFPDGPNKAHFPPCILEPGAESGQISELRFGFA